MIHKTLQMLALSAAVTGAAFAAPVRVQLSPANVTNEAKHGEPGGMVDEQADIGDPTNAAPSGKPAKGRTIPSQFNKTEYPASAYVDLGEVNHVTGVWIYDLNGKGDLIIAAGKPGEWRELTTYDCGKYNTWVEVPVTASTQFLRFTRKDPGSNFTEIAVYATTAEEFAGLKAKADAEAKEKADKEAAAARLAAEREAGRARAAKEAANRKTVELETFGKVTIVDEIDVAAADPGHMFSDDPKGVTEVQTILGKPARVLKKTAGEAAYMNFRVGQYKNLKPGQAYVLEIEYPEDLPRSWIVNSSGNEASIGWATGEALGDAFRPKYVNNLNESLKYPLSGKYKTWTMFFHLHDRFPNLKYVRGEAGNRELTVDDGFTVTIAQYSAESIPASHGAAVSRIRLYEVADQKAIAAKVNLPKGLPARHIFWREEMADGVIGKEKNGTPSGLNKPLDWYRFKADQMAFLGINTYTKDLLEFGAVQHWDSSPHGGDKWAFYNREHAPLWSQIVQLMGERGHTILPYYEYAGSKGQQGLGPQKRAKPLTRDDAFTHIKWVENANADVTDPDTIEDFKKMLDVTILREKNKAKFVGAWIRPRSQMPMGFGDTTRARFAEEANGGREITRQQLKEDKQLYAKYVEWWQGKRKQFFIAARDYLRQNGIDDAVIIYHGYPGEPGYGFKGAATMVVDDPAAWKPRFEAFADSDERFSKTRLIGVKGVVDDDLYTIGLQSPPANWGGWELQHSNPLPDPQHYKDVEGVLMSMPFNRVYTAASPKPFDLFRAPSGLAIMRHYSLNENMIFDKNNKDKLGYFAADIERAGPFCMAGEALAMANGDPTYLGYLVGRTYMKGFPQYVRAFNTAYLALPALPSEKINAASSPQVVVRQIKTPKNGTYFAVVNTGMTDAAAVKVKLPAGKVTDAATGEVVKSAGGSVELTMYPYQLRAFHVQ